MSFEPGVRSEIHVEVEDARHGFIVPRSVQSAGWVQKGVQRFAVTLQLPQCHGTDEWIWMGAL